MKFNHSKKIQHERLPLNYCQVYRTKTQSGVSDAVLWLLKTSSIKIDGNVINSLYIVTKCLGLSFTGWEEKYANLILYVILDDGPVYIV